MRIFPGFALSVPSLHCMCLQLWGVTGEMVPKNGYHELCTFSVHLSE